MQAFCFHFLAFSCTCFAAKLHPRRQAGLAREVHDPWTPNAMPAEASSNGKRHFLLAHTRLTAPFCAFAGAGGQALARYALDHADLVKGKRVLDFASGSGLIAIATAKAGAAEVTASDIDAFAIAAIEANSAENTVVIAPRLENLIGADEGWEVVLAGDIAYEKDFAGAAMDWLQSLARRGASVLIGDPRRSYLPLDRLDCVIEYSVPMTRELEDSEIKRTGVFHFSASPPV